MITGLDSATEPSAAAVLAAKAAGVSLWSGYISTAPYDGESHFGLWHPWSREAFENARLCGSKPIAYCSGWDDPIKLKTQAEIWNVRLCLDVEGGIRADGPWVQDFLYKSGAGIYGNYGCHTGRNAAFHVLAAYPGINDPSGTWWNQTQRPGKPCGWQWVGTHTEFGVGVDRGDFDDWFAQPDIQPEIQTEENNEVPASSFVRQAFIVGGSGVVWQYRQDPTSKSWSWISLGGTALPQKVEVSGALNVLDIYVKGQLNSLWHRHSEDAGATFGDWDNDNDGLILPGASITAIGPGAAEIEASEPSEPSSQIDVTSVSALLSEILGVAQSVEKKLDAAGKLL